MKLKAFWPPILIAIGIFLMENVLRNNGSPLIFFSGITFLCFGIIGLALIKEGDYAISTIKTIEKSIKNRGLLGWVIGLVLTCFYILLYWYQIIVKKSFVRMDWTDGSFSQSLHYIRNHSIVVNGISKRLPDFRISKNGIPGI